MKENVYEIWQTSVESLALSNPGLQPSACHNTSILKSNVSDRGSVSRINCLSQMDPDDAHGEICNVPSSFFVILFHLVMNCRYSDLKKALHNLCCLQLKNCGTANKDNLP